MFLEISFIGKMHLASLFGLQVVTRFLPHVQNGAVLWVVAKVFGVVARWLLTVSSGESPPSGLCDILVSPQ